MTGLDFAPLFRTAIGFDRLARLVDNAASAAEAPSYPPYNIEKTGEDTYRITMAVAGFGSDDIELVVKDNTLVVSGRVANETAKAEVLEVQNGRLAPRAAALDRIAAAAGALCVTATAKVLKVGPKSLFQRLHRMRWLYRRPGSRVWLGRENVVRAGFLTHDSRLIKRGDGTERVVEQVKVTAKGLARLAGLLNQGALRLKGPA